MKIGDIFNAEVLNGYQVTGVTLSLRAFSPFSVKIGDVFGDSFDRGQVTQNGDVWSPYSEVKMGQNSYL